MQRLTPQSFITILGLLWFPTMAVAAPPPGLLNGGVANVIGTVDGDTLVLSGGQEVRLVGIQAPKLPLGRRSFTQWPMADEARAHLSSLVEGREVTLYFGGAREDRHGRRLAHVMTGDGRWIQGEMLAAGLARVYTFADNRLAAREMLAAEASARAMRRGIWSHDFYRIRAANQIDDLSKLVDTYQLVEGSVARVDRVKEQIFINFGADWRRDFTIRIAVKDLRRFRDSSLDPVSWSGRSLRVRGWIKLQNGPLIEVTHPEQIEFLSR